MVSNFKIFFFLLSVSLPCYYAHKATRSSDPISEQVDPILAKLKDSSTSLDDIISGFKDAVAPFFNVTQSGKIIFSDMTKIIDHKVPASLKPDPQTGVSTKDVIICQATNLRARLFFQKITNKTEKLPILLYFHGGGFAIGSAFWSKDDAYLKKVASKAHAIVVSIDYRLWPRHPIPAAYEDGYSALKWLASQKKRVGAKTFVAKYGDFSRIFLGGDSSGGNIVHNVVMRTKVQSLPENLKITGVFLAMPYFLGSKPVGSETALGLANSPFNKLWKYVCPKCGGGIDNPWMNPFSTGAPSMSNINCKKMMVYGATEDKFFYFRSRWYANEAKTHGFKGAIEYFEIKGDHVFHIMDGDKNPDTSILIQRLASFINTN